MYRATIVCNVVYFGQAPVLEPIDPGSILAGGFLEGLDFTLHQGRFGGRPPFVAELVDLAYKELGDIVPPHSRAVSTAPSTCFTLCALNGCYNQFKIKKFKCVFIFWTNNYGLYKDCKTAPKLAMRVASEQRISTSLRLKCFVLQFLLLMDTSSLTCNLEFSLTSKVGILYWDCQL